MDIPTIVLTYGIHALFLYVMVGIVIDNTYYYPLRVSLVAITVQVLLTLFLIIVIYTKDAFLYLCYLYYMVWVVVALVISFIYLYRTSRA